MFRNSKVARPRAIPVLIGAGVTFGGFLLGLDVVFGSIAGALAFVVADAAIQTRRAAP